MSENIFTYSKLVIRILLLKIKLLYAKINQKQSYEFEKKNSVLINVNLWKIIISRYIELLKIFNLKWEHSWKIIFIWLCITLKKLCTYLHKGRFTSSKILC